MADRTPGNRRIELIEFPGRVRRQRVLAEFGGSRAENRINNLPKRTMMRMEEGQTVVKVVPLNGNNEMSSKHTKVRKRQGRENAKVDGTRSSRYDTALATFESVLEESQFSCWAKK